MMTESRSNRSQVWWKHRLRRTPAGRRGWAATTSTGPDGERRRAPKSRRLGRVVPPQDQSKWSPPILATCRCFGRAGVPPDLAPVLRDSGHHRCRAVLRTPRSAWRCMPLARKPARSQVRPVGHRIRYGAVMFTGFHVGAGRLATVDRRHPYFSRRHDQRRSATWRSWR